MKYSNILMLCGFSFLLNIFVLDCSNDCKNTQMQHFKSKKNIIMDTLANVNDNIILEICDTSYSPKDPYAILITQNKMQQVIQGIDYKKKQIVQVNIDALYEKFKSIPDSDFVRLFMQITWLQERYNRYRINMVKYSDTFILSNSIGDTLSIKKSADNWMIDTISYYKGIRFE